MRQRQASGTLTSTARQARVLRSRSARMVRSGVLSTSGVLSIVESGYSTCGGRREDALSWQHTFKMRRTTLWRQHFRVLPRVSSKCNWKVVALCKSSGLCPHLRAAFAMGGGSDLQRLSGGENCVLGMVTGIMAKACNYPFLVWKNTVQQGLKISLDPVRHRSRGRGEGSLWHTSVQLSPFSVAYIWHTFGIHLAYIWHTSGIHSRGPSVAYRARTPD